MNYPKLTLTIAATPLLGVVLYYSWVDGHDGDSLPSQKNGVEKRVRGVASEPMEQGGRSRLVDEGEATETQLSELQRKSEGIIARLSTVMTDEKRTHSLQKRLDWLVPQYVAIFRQFKLDQATSDQAIEIVRERETRMSAARARFYKRGLGEAESVLVDVKVEEELAREHLRKLLGPLVFQEVERLERKLDSDAASKLHKLVEERRAD